MRHGLCSGGGPESIVRNIRKDDGFTLIDMLFVCGLIGILSVIALPGLLMAKEAAGSASAIGSLRAINSGELTYALTCGGGFYAPDLTTLGMAPAGSNEAYLSPNLTTGNVVQKAGYTIQLQGTAYGGAPATCNGLAPGVTAQGFKAGADPASIQNPRFFATNANGQLYENNATMYAATPELGEPAIGHVLH